MNDNEATCPNSSIKAPEVETEVQIMDLKDVYNKKMKKTLEGLEYRLEDSEVTVVVQASEEITSVRAYTQRCSEAAIRTHDTLGRLLQLYPCYAYFHQHRKTLTIIWLQLTILNFLLSAYFNVLYYSDVVASFKATLCNWVQSRR